MTWVPQNRQGKLNPSLRECSAPPPFQWGQQLLWLGYRRIGRGSSTPHSGGAPHPLRSTGKHSTKVNRAFGPARSFSIVNPRGRQLKARLYSSELSYRTLVLQSCSSFSSFSRVDFCTLSEGGGPLRSVRKSLIGLLYTFGGRGGGSVGPLLGQSQAFQVL